MKREKVLGIIPSRFKSRRFPGKPLAKIAGKSLLQRVFENASQCKRIDKLLIATDDERISDHAKAFGATVIMTKESCASGTDRCTEVIQDNPEFIDYPYIINIQGDEPLLEPSVINSVIQALEHAPMASAKKKIQNPSCVKCVCDLSDRALLFSRSLPNQEGVFEHLGIYGYRREFLLKLQHLSKTPLQLAEDLEQLQVLEHGFSIKVPTVQSRSIGVDHPEDIEKVEKIL